MKPTKKERFKKLPFGEYIKTQDKTKPRFRDTNFKQEALDITTYNKWKVENPNSNITQVQFYKITSKLFEKYTNKVVENIDGVTLPFYLGNLKINYISYIDAVDSKKSLLTNKKTKSLNWDTGNRVGKIVWQRKYAIRHNNSLATLAFKGCRNFTKKVHKSILEDSGRYKDSGK